MQHHIWQTDGGEGGTYIHWEERWEAYLPSLNAANLYQQGPKRNSAKHRSHTTDRTVPSTLLRPTVGRSPRCTMFECLICNNNRFSHDGPMHPDCICGPASTASPVSSRQFLVEFATHRHSYRSSSIQPAESETEFEVCQTLPHECRFVVCFPSRHLTRERCETETACLYVVLQLLAFAEREAMV